MKKKYLLLFLAASSCMLSSCQFLDYIESAVNSTLNNSDNASEDYYTFDTSIDTENGFYKYENIVTENINLKKLNQSQGCDTFDTYSGTPLEILVIPIELSDYKFSKTCPNILTELDHVLNGNGATDTGYWESVASYYNKASYGKFNVHYTISDIYSTGYTAKSMMERKFKDTEAADFTQLIVRDAIKDYKKNNGNSATNQFDADKDGFIDGVVMVYSCPDANSNDPFKVINGIDDIDADAEYYWAYCYWDFYADANKTSPAANSYFWASYSFLHEAVKSPKVDSHTFIHESGHMMGLDDYYSYDEDNDRYPAGGADMMDYNIGDQSAFSKMALGWLDPYVVTDSCTIEIRPSEAYGDAILLPKSNWNGTIFDEYLLLELYTPTGLNKLDADSVYTSVRNYTRPGVKLWHVDNRISKVTTSALTGKETFEAVTKIPASFIASDYVSYVSGISNSKDRDEEPYSKEGDYDLLRLIEADGSGRLNSSAGESYLGNNNLLFKTNGHFSPSINYKSFVKRNSNVGLFDDGSKIPYDITFNYVGSDKAIITIKKI